MRSSLGWDTFAKNLRNKRFNVRVFRKAFVPVGLLVRKDQAGIDGVTYDALCTDCGIKDCHWADHSDPENYPDDLITYKTNSFGFRSDEFSKSLAPKNYLYSGCSITFGTGLPYNQTWAYMLNQHLGKEVLFNLGVSGSGYESILANAYNYIEKYGNPKGIFLLMPNLQRDIRFVNHNNGLIPHYSHYGDEQNYPQVDASSYSYEVMYFKFYRQMLHFEYYCHAKKIPLIWATWDSELDEAVCESQFSCYVKHFHSLKNKSLIKTPKEKGKYWSMGRDQHRGADYALEFAQTFEMEWRKRNEKTA